MTFMSDECMRVLRIVSVMNKGGIETQIMNIYRKIDRTRFQFDFLVTREESGIYDAEIRALGGRIFQIPSVRESGLFKFTKNCDMFFKKHPEYKIVHCHMNTWAGLFLNVARRNKVPVRIAQSHSAQQRANSERGIKGMMEDRFKATMKRLIPFGATHFWACGNDAGKWLYGERIAETNMQIVPNAKELEMFRYDVKKRTLARNSLGLSPNDLVVGHVGSFTRVKNHRFIIEVFRELHMLREGSRLVLVGEGPLQPVIRQQVSQLGLEDKVVFLGTRNDVHVLLSAFDVMLFPSLFEGMPNVLIEAQASALPCVISSEITPEIDFDMGLVDFLPLTYTPEKWARRLLEKSCVNRKKVSIKNLVDRGYDLQTLVNWLEEFYEGCCQAT